MKCMRQADIGRKIDIDGSPDVCGVFFAQRPVVSDAGGEDRAVQNAGEPVDDPGAISLTLKIGGQVFQIGKVGGQVGLAAPPGRYDSMAAGREQPDDVQTDTRRGSCDQVGLKLLGWHTLPGPSGGCHRPISEACAALAIRAGKMTVRTSAAHPVVTRVV